MYFDIDKCFLFSNGCPIQSGIRQANLISTHSFKQVFGTVPVVLPGMRKWICIGCWLKTRANVGTRAPKFVPSEAKKSKGSWLSTSVASDQPTKSLLHTFWNNLCSNYMEGQGFECSVSHIWVIFKGGLHCIYYMGTTYTVYFRESS